MRVLFENFLRSYCVLWLRTWRRRQTCLFSFERGCVCFDKT